MVYVYLGDRQIDCTVEEYKELFGDVVLKPSKRGRPKKVDDDWDSKKMEVD